MNVMRLNFSHGTHDYHRQTILNLRKFISSCRNPKIVGILLDTKGPEIRTGKLQEGKEVELAAGKPFSFYTDFSYVGDEFGVAVSYPTLYESVEPGDVILVDDGLISFRVTECSVGVVETVVLNSGVLGETKGVNLPGIQVDLPAITEKDAADIRFGIEMQVDFIAASFIRKATDVLHIRKMLEGTGIQIISKIENQEGLDNFDEILAVSDGIMIARGDLGVEIPVEDVFRAQKMMIRKCNYAGKPSITATQMLDSMIHNPRPTRAEATDVANAVLDGSDCVMLSGETAKGTTFHCYDITNMFIGSYPIETVKIMASICREAEADIDYAELYAALRRQILLPIPISESIASVAVKTAWDVHAPLIIALTEKGSTAMAICKYRPIPPVIAVTATPRVARQFQILRGIYPFLTETMQGTDNVVTKAMLYGVQLNVADKGDNVVITSGLIEQVSGSTNSMRVSKCIGFEV